MEAPGLRDVGRALLAGLVVVLLGVLLETAVSGPQPRPRALHSSGVVDLEALKVFCAGVMLRQINPGASTEDIFESSVESLAKTASNRAS